MLSLTIIVPRLDPQTRKATAHYPNLMTLFLRFTCHIVDALPFYVGFLRPIWNLNKQTWADTIVGTLVMDRWPHDRMILTEDPGGVRDVLPA